MDTTSASKRILGCLAHPDDEILGPGGTLAHYAQQGAHIEMVYTTRGEAGEIADPTLATPETLGAVREAELRCAAQTLGIANLHFLDYRDSGMAGTEDNQHPDAYINVPDKEVVARLVAIIRQVRPQVMFTFEPFGGYGHPDHIAIHHHTHQALAAAANPGYHPHLGAAWSVSRLFYPLVRATFFYEMKARMLALGMDVSFFDVLEERRKEGWSDDNYQVAINIDHTLSRKLTAFHCHRTQFGENNLFRRLPESDMAELLQIEYFALAYPTPAPGLQLADWFEGLP